MLRLRIATALVLVAVFAGALFGLPPAGWAAFVCALVGVGAWEWGGFARLGHAARVAYAAATAAACAGIAVALGLAAGRPGALTLLPVYAATLAFWLFAAPWWLRHPSRPGPTAVLLAVGWIVLVPTFLACVHLRNIHPATLLAFMALVWIADIAAYFAGRRFGRHKLAPAVSPGKTWEGLYGALAATAAYAVLWMAAFPQHAPALVRDLPASGLVMAVLVVGLAALSVIGDLFESAMKRQAGVKDSGRILPGHGGVLDRIDALTPVLPVAALVSMV